MQQEKAFPVLKTILEDDFGPDIEEIILKSMAQVNSVQADEYLISRLNNNAPEFQQRQQSRAATALGYCSSQISLQALGRALVSPSTETRIQVINALGKRGANQYIRAIVLSLADHNALVKHTAAKAFKRLAKQTQNNLHFDYNKLALMLERSPANSEDNLIQAAILEYFKEQYKITDISASLNQSSQNLFIQCLSSTNNEVVTQAIQLASLTLNSSSISALFDITLSDKHTSAVKKEAILALGHLLNTIEDKRKQQQAIIKLTHLSYHNDPGISAVVLQALVINSNNNSVYDWTKTISHILQKNHDKAGLSTLFDHLQDLLDSQDADVRISCIKALTYFDTSSALACLLDCLQDKEDKVCLQALQGLSSILTSEKSLLSDEQKDQIIKALYTNIEHSNKEITLSAIDALITCQSSPNIERFIEIALSNEGQLVKPIAQSLIKQHYQQTIQQLLSLFDNSSNSNVQLELMKILEPVIHAEHMAN